MSDAKTTTAVCMGRSSGSGALTLNQKACTGLAASSGYLGRFAGGGPRLAKKSATSAGRCSMG